MKYTYLLINLAVILGPIFMSCEKKLHFVDKWKTTIIPISLNAILFLIWDYLFIQQGVWGFNPDYIIGINILNIPIEEILFFITIPFAGLFVYEVVRFYDKKLPVKISKIIIIVVSMLIGVIAILNPIKLYTYYALGLCAIINLLMIISKAEHNYYLTSYIIILIPFLIVNGILTAIPIVEYNDIYNLGIRIGTIPLEDIFFGMTLNFLNFRIYDLIRQKKQ